MIFGFDFDNTIINYDSTFYITALNRKLINKKTKRNKESIKKILIKKRGIKEWIKLQSSVYSQEINKAKPNNKLIAVLKLLKKKKIKFYIVSHKTKFPYFGKKIDLHKISKNWLDKNIFNRKNKIEKCKCYFETSIKKKIERIKKLKISHFVDDLQEIIDLLPSNIVGVLYRKKNFKIKKIKKIINSQKATLI